MIEPEHEKQLAEQFAKQLARKPPSELGSESATTILGHMMADVYSALVKLHKLGIKVDSKACRRDVRETIFGAGGAFDWFQEEPNGSDAA